MKHGPNEHATGLGSCRSTWVCACAVPTLPVRILAVFDHVRPLFDRCSTVVRPLFDRCSTVVRPSFDRRSIVTRPTLLIGLHLTPPEVSFWVQQMFWGGFQAVSLPVLHHVSCLSLSGINPTWNQAKRSAFDGFSCVLKLFPRFASFSCVFHAFWPYSAVFSTFCVISTLFHTISHFFSIFQHFSAHLSPFHTFLSLFTPFTPFQAAFPLFMLFHVFSAVSCVLQYSCIFAACRLLFFTRRVASSAPRRPHRAVSGQEPALARSPCRFTLGHRSHFAAQMTVRKLV